ncbi:MAG: sensor histidine kinase [Geminicoccaceae bacterium]
MTQSRSLRLRLLLSAAVLIVAAVAVTGLILAALFRDHVRAQYDTELVNHLNQLTSLLQFDGQHQLGLSAEPSDPRFQTPYGGRYWQVEPTGQLPLRSRSLWDQALTLEDAPPAPGKLHRHMDVLPAIGRLLVLERLVRFHDAPDKPIRVAVALPTSEIAAVTGHFNRLLGMALSVLAAGLIAASALQVAIGLMPLARLGRALTRVRSGAAGRLEGDFPSEVRPLADELNDLLVRQERLVQRARAQAGDLAHGLKTSLQLLLLEADRLSDPVQGDRIRASVLRMRTLIEHQLARARAQSRAQVRGPGVAVADSVAALVRVLGPLAAEHGVIIETTVPPDGYFSGDAADLDEMLGNLLDNACKWGRTKVLVTVRTLDAQLEISVEDDGPGLTDTQAEALFRRGARLDERVPGSGLGLAIARDLAEIYGGTVYLQPSALGGLAAILILPQA